MALDVEIPVEIIENSEESSSKTYRLDLANGRIIGTVDKLEAVNQAIMKVIKTERYYNLIYDNNYGSEIKEMVYDKTASRELIETSLPQIIGEALLQDTRIIEVYNFNFEFKDDSCFVSFSVNTIFGETEVETIV